MEQPNHPNRIADLRQRAGLTQAELADRANTSEPQINRLENGKRRLTEEWRERLARALKVEPADLLSTSSVDLYEKSVKFPQLDQQSVIIKELDMGLGAGGGGDLRTYFDDEGGLPEDSPAVSRWAVSKRFLGAIPGHPAAGDLYIFEVVGHSAEPVFMPGTRVLVNSADRWPSPPGPFVVWDGFSLVIKMVEFVPHSDPPTVRLVSANSIYQTYERALGEAYIQGRVTGSWKWT